MKDFPIIKASNLSLSQRRLVHGVGINDAEYIATPTVNGKQLTCPVYAKWKDMLMRCYSARYQEKHPTYKGCSVVEEWKTFSNFKKWMLQQSWEGLELDKDLLVQGNKLYGPETCVFIPMNINRLFNNHSSSRGCLMAGVSASNGRFKSGCRVDGKTKHLGRFDTEIEAHNAYKKFKYALISKVASLEGEPVKSALLRYVIRAY